MPAGKLMKYILDRAQTDIKTYASTRGLSISQGTTWIFSIFQYICLRAGLKIINNE